MSEGWRSNATSGWSALWPVLPLRISLRYYGENWHVLQRILVLWFCQLRLSPPGSMLLAPSPGQEFAGLAWKMRLQFWAQSTNDEEIEVQRVQDSSGVPVPNMSSYVPKPKAYRNLKFLSAINQQLLKVKIVGCNEFFEGPMGLPWPELRWEACSFLGCQEWPLRPHILLH